MPDLRVVDGLLRLSPDDDPEAGLAMGALVHVMEPDGSGFDVPIEQVQQSADLLTLSGAAGGFEVRATWRRAGRVTADYEVELTVHH